MTTGSPELASEPAAGASNEARAARLPGGKQKKSYGKTAKKGAVWSAMRQGGNELMAIPTSMIMARLLTPRDFGITVAATFFIQLAARLTQFGFSSALVRTKELRPEHVSTVFVTNLTLGTVTYLALVAASPFIGQFFRSPESGSLVPIAALTFVIGPIGTVSAALMQRNMQFRYSALCDWTDTLVGAAATIALAYSGYGYWSIPYGNVIAAAARVTMQLFLSGWGVSFTFSRAALRELIPFGLGLQSKRLLEYAASSLDNVVVGRVIGITALGFYDKAFTTMGRLVTRLTLGQAPFRIFAIIHEDRARFQRAYARLITSITLIGYPVLAGCIVVARPLFTVVYGEQWLPAVVPFQLLCVGGMLRLLGAYSGQANEAVGNIWAQVACQAVGTVLVVIGAAVGGAYGGITGAALGVVLATTVLTASLQELVRRATGLSWKEMLLPQAPGVMGAVLLVAVLLGVGAAIRLVLPQPAPWQLLLGQALAGAAFYLGFVIFSPFAAVRAIVRESVEDLLPARVARFINGPATSKRGGLVDERADA